jgi:hypothetical protein
MAAQAEPADWAEHDVKVTLEDLVAQKLMAQEDDRFIALAIPLSGAWVTEGILDRIIAEADGVGLLDSLRMVAEQLMCET